MGAGESVCTGLEAPLASLVLPLPFSSGRGGCEGDFVSPGRGGNGANAWLE